MQTQETAEKIKALFLNKVKGLEWHYFDDEFKTINDLNPYEEMSIHIRMINTIILTN